MVFFYFLFFAGNHFLRDLFLCIMEKSQKISKKLLTNFMPYGIVRHGSIAGINTATGTLFSAFTWAVLAG